MVILFRRKQKEPAALIRKEIGKSYDDEFSYSQRSHKFDFESVNSFWGFRWMSIHIYALKSTRSLKYQK